MNNIIVRIRNVVVMLSLFLTNSCDVKETTSSNPSNNFDIIITNIDQTLETIHSSYYNEVEDSYLHSLSLELYINSPERANEIKRVIIFDTENNLGWEIGYDILESSYDSDHGLFRVNHLAFTGSFYGDHLLKVYMYDDQNRTQLNTYTCVLNAGFPPRVSSTNDWFDHDVLQITLDDQDNFISNGMIHWLNNDEITDSSIVLFEDNETAIVESIPVEANGYYLEFNYQNNGINRRVISPRELIKDRLPSDLFLFDSDFNIDQVVYINSIEKIVILDEENAKASIIPIGQTYIESTIILPGSPSIMKKSEVEEVYIGLENGNVYHLNNVSFEIEFIHSFGSQLNDMIIIEDYIVANTGDR